MERLDLPTLIDLEAQLARDADQLPQVLEDRDAAIAPRIDAAKLDGVPLYLAWWRELRKQTYGDKPTPGERFVHWHDTANVALMLAGVVIGFASMWGYLTAVTASGWPVNVIHFVAVFVGVEWLLLLLWLVLVLHVPLGAVSRLLAGVQALLPRLLAKVGRAGEALQLGGRMYAKLRLWWISRVTQGFTLALNVGFVLAFIGASVFSDPSFGWRSTLLEAPQVYEASRALSAPWAWAAPNATVLESEVYETRFSSLDAERFTMDKLPIIERDAWRVWWMFLCVTLVVYGVLPRVLTWVVSGIGMRRQLRRVRLDHAEFQFLRDRLKRPGRQATHGSEGGYVPAAVTDVGDVALLRWSGVQVEDERLRELSRARLAVRVLGVRRIGGIDVGEDEAAMRWAAEQGADVGVVVEGWEPPVGDYLDTLRKLRRAIGETKQIVVIVCGEDAAAPTARQMTIWSDAARSLRDPRLRTVELLREEALP